MTSTSPCWPLSQTTVKQVLEICGVFILVCVVICFVSKITVTQPLESSELPTNLAYTEMGVCLVGSLVILVFYKKRTTARSAGTFSLYDQKPVSRSSGKLASKDDVSLTRPDVKSYNSVIEACLKTNDFPRAERWLSKLYKSGLQPTVNTFSMFLEASITIGDSIALDFWLQKMRESGVAWNKSVYDMLIHTYATCGKITSAEALMEEMIENGFPPSYMNYTTLVTECVRINDLDGAFRCVVAFKSHNPIKSAKCCTDILNTWALQGDSRECEVWLGKMLAAGILPSQDACTFVISCSAKAANLGRADRLYTVMAQKGIYPKAQAVIAMITACARMGHTAEGKMWLGRLEEADLLDPTVYRNVLSSYAKVGDIIGASTYMMKMEERGLVPDLFAHNSMLHACVKAGDLDAMSHWLQVMKERDVQCDAIVCNTVMNAYSAAGDAAMVMKIFDEIRSKGMSPDDVSYAIAAKSCAAQGDLPKVEQLIEEMLSKGLEMRDHHLCALLLAHTNVRPRQHDRAEEAFRCAVAAGVKVTRPVVIGLARAVGWSRCNSIIGSRDRRRILAQPH